MTHKIKFAPGDAEKPPGAAVRVLRGLILLGVWVLVGIAGLTAWARLSA